MKRSVLLSLFVFVLAAGVPAATKNAAVRARPAAKPATAVKAKPATAPVQSKYRRSPYVGALAVDAATGRVLFENGADTVAYPASVTKLMTAYLVLEDLKAGKFALGDRVVASPTQSRADVHFRQPSCVGMRAGESLSVEELLKALLVHSANDAAVFLGEKCSGSMAAFVVRMNQKAAALGMMNTRYYNPNGLPPANRGSGQFNTSTCRDLALLARDLLARHPEVLKYTSVKKYEAHLPSGATQVFVNHNNVMVKDRLKIFNPDGSEAVDGLKTGYIDAGGSSIVLTASRNGRRIIAIVLGSTSARERDENVRRIAQDALNAIAL